MAAVVDVGNSPPTWLAPAGFALAVLPVCLAPGVSFTLVTQRTLDVPCSPASASPLS